MIGGVHGKILHIDLSSGAFCVEEPPEAFYRLLVGGRAVIAFLLLRDLPPGIDPLSEENLLIFAPGILQGSNLPGTGRHAVGGKSPLTGAIGSSEAGGWWGNEFKHTGFDALVVHGKADKPVFISIQNEQVEIRPAAHLWGLETAPVEEQIRAELGDDKVRIAQIGPAGENRVRYAAIMHDVTRAAGRNGMGAVMGSKNLKAVAVRGTQKMPIAQRSAVTSVARWFGKNYKQLMPWAAAGVGLGTLDGIEVWSYLGGLPTKNFSEPVFEAVGELDGARLHELYLKERDTCQACPVFCKVVFEHREDNPKRDIDPVYCGAEYEAVAGFGSNCGVSDALAVLKANELCNAYGLDTISTSMSIAFLMESFEKGAITAEDTDGLTFHWGDAETILRAVELIAHREEVGDLMAEGVARMSEHFGLETMPFNLTIKGQELPLHEPRLKQSLALGYAVSPLGADHIVNVQDHYYQPGSINLQRVNSVLEEPIESLSPKGLDETKLQLIHHEINWQHFQDSAISCHHFAYAYEHLAKALSGVTGVNYSNRDVLDVGARAQTLARLFNQREGFTAADDKLPDRFFDAFQSGPIAGVAVSAEELAWAKHRFYELMHWDKETGSPTDECLQELQLSELLSQCKWDCRNSQ